MIEHESNSPEETMEIGARIATRLRPGDVIALHGELGAGKTCFVRGLASGLGLDPRRVSSPTFVFVQEYAPAPDAPPGVTLVHIDAYRISGEDDLDGIGWGEIMAADDVIVAVEWPERVAAVLPEDHIKITLEHAAYEHQRRICIEGLRAVTACPICKAKVTDELEFFPFCSDRCRLVDLGKWIGGDYTISRPANDPRDWEEN